MYVFTLQRHSPVVLLQFLWNPLLVSQLHGPHMGLPHQPSWHFSSTLPLKTTGDVKIKRKLQSTITMQKWFYLSKQVEDVIGRYEKKKIKFAVFAE